MIVRVLWHGCDSSRFRDRREHGAASAGSCSAGQVGVEVES